MAMYFKHGKYKGMLICECVIMHPDNAHWYINNWEREPYHSELLRLVDIFDQAPILCGCSNCGKLAAKAVARDGSPVVCCYCDKCSKRRFRRYGDRDVTTYFQAVEHIIKTTLYGKSEKELIIRNLSRCKGMPKNIAPKDIIDFFEL